MFRITIEFKIQEQDTKRTCRILFTVNGYKSSCLLDTGSQVTTIPVTFYNKQLSDQPVQALEDLLQVEGAAGQTIPYLGYIQTTVEFPKDFVGCTNSVPTLALIVPDVRPGFPTSILIAMNTLETLYDKFQQSDYSSFQPHSFGYRAVLQTLYVTYQQSCSDHIVVVTLHSKSSVLIPAGHKIILEGSGKVSDQLISMLLSNTRIQACRLGCALAAVY